MLFSVPILLPSQPGAAPPALALQQGQTMEYQGLKVEYQTVSFEADGSTAVFGGPIKATYDQTVITSQTLKLNYQEQTGVAEGGVVLTDPAAHMTTDRLEFNWKLKTGSANKVYVQVGNMRIRAETLDIAPEEWNMKSVRATLSRRKNPQYEIIAKSARIKPGQEGVASRVSLNLFGLHIGSVPEMRFGLDPRIDGFNLPSIVERKGAGLGVSWNSSFFLGEKFVLGGTFGAFPQRFPGYSADITWMDADPNKVFRRLKPQEDLIEQTGDGWFDNISVRGPRSEALTIGSPRLLYKLGTRWNGSTFARPDNSKDVSKAYEAVVESAGRADGFSLRINARMQDIRESSDSPFVNRFASQLTALSPAWYLGRGLGLQLRTDVLNTMSADNQFGWVRGQASLLWSPMNGVTMGLAYSDSDTFGTPDFGFDRRLYDRAVHGRIDYIRGPFTLRGLWKYDPVSHAIFDHEYEFAIVAESFEPFMVWRQQPSDFRIGVRFRISEFRQRLQRRQVKREVQQPF